MHNIILRETLLLALPKNEYNQLNSLQRSHKIWGALESTFEGDKHAKSIRLQNWMFLFQDTKMMEDEHIRSSTIRISKMVERIKSCNGTKDEDEIIWIILKTLTPKFKKTTPMVKQVIPYLKKFTKEALLGRLEAKRVSLNKTRDLPRV